MRPRCKVKDHLKTKEVAQYEGSGLRSYHHTPQYLFKLELQKYSSALQQHRSRHQQSSPSPPDHSTLQHVLNTAAKRGQVPAVTERPQCGLLLLPASLLPPPSSLDHLLPEQARLAVASEPLTPPPNEVLLENPPLTNGVVLFCTPQPQL